jgi:NAD(P)-dependent dehydrogenase (short-subunit alcohol dehydrogenase family)
MGETQMDVANLFSVKGKVVVITGGSRGIGKMFAEGFVRGGAKVYITARKAAACDATAEELSAFGECISIPIDGSTMEGIDALVAEIGKREKHIDVLINNAGAAWGAPFDEFPESGWDKVMDLNVKSVFFLTQRFAPLLRAGASAAKPAKVINVASIDGMSVNPQETYSYHASKAGLIHLTKKMGAQLAPENIVVSGINPGAFPSEMNKVARDEGDSVSARVPSRRVGIPEDMAAVAIYLASKAGDYVVGQSIAVDGGVTVARGS